MIKRSKRKFPFYRKTLERFYNISDSKVLDILKNLTQNLVHKLFLPRFRDNLLYLTLTFNNDKFSNSEDFLKSKLELEKFIQKIDTQLLFSVIENHKNGNYHFHLVFSYKRISEHDCFIEKKRSFYCKICSKDYEKLWSLGLISLRRVGINRSDYYNVIYYMVEELSCIGYFFDKVLFCDWYFPNFSQSISDWFKNYKQTNSFSYLKKYFYLNKTRQNLIKLKSKIKKKIFNKPSSRLLNKWSKKLLEIENKLKR